MEYRDYYAVLGVPRTATQAEIKKAFRSWRGSTIPTRTRRHRGRAALQGGQRGQRGPVRPGEAQAVRPARAQLGGVSAGPVPAAPAARRRPARSPGFGGAARPAARQAATSATSSAATPRTRASSQRLLPHLLRRERGPADVAAPAAGGRTSRRQRRDDRPRGPPRPAMGGGAARLAAGATARPRARRRAQPRPRRRPRSRSTRPSTGTKRLVDVDGKRLEVTIPRGRRHRHTDPLYRQGGRAAATSTSSSASAPRPVFTRKRRGPRARAADHPRRGAARRRGPGSDAEGHGRCSASRRDPERPHVPAHRPGHAALPRRRPRRPVRQGPGRPADRPRRRRPGEAAAAHFLDLVDQPDPRLTRARDHDT